MPLTAGDNDRKVQNEALQELQTLFDLAVAIIMITAVELVIQWNHLQRSNGMSTVAQLIPTIVSAGVLMRVFFLWLAGRGESDGSESSRPSSRLRSPPPIPFHYPRDPGGGGGGATGIREDDIIVDEEASDMDMSSAATSLRGNEDNIPGPAGLHHQFPPQPPPPPPGPMQGGGGGGRPPPRPI